MPSNRTDGAGGRLKGSSVKCALCHIAGHNKRSCPTRQSVGGCGNSSGSQSDSVVRGDRTRGSLNQSQIHGYMARPALQIPASLSSDTQLTTRSGGENVAVAIPEDGDGGSVGDGGVGGFHRVSGGENTNGKPSTGAQSINIASASASASRDANISASAIPGARASRNGDEGGGGGGGGSGGGGDTSLRGGVWGGRSPPTHRSLRLEASARSRPRCRDERNFLGIGVWRAPIHP